MGTSIFELLYISSFVIKEGDMSQQPRRLFPMIPILKDRPIPSPKDFRDEFSPTWKTFTRFHKKGKIIFLDLFPLLERKFHQHWISLALSFTLTPRLCVCVSLENSENWKKSDAEYFCQNQLSLKKSLKKAKNSFGVIRSPFPHSSLRDSTRDIDK